MKTPVTTDNQARGSKGKGMILIRDGALLPPNLVIELESFLPGWCVVKNCDGYVLGRKIKEANWKYVRFTGEYTARVLGRESNGILRRGVTQILAKLRGRRFNSMEITAVTLRRFLGLACLNVSVNLWHLQDDLKARATGTGS